MIRNPRELDAADIPAERVPIGGKLEYKANIAPLGGDEILLLNYLNDVPQGLLTYLYRSHDPGRTWEGGRSQTQLPDDATLVTAYSYSNAEVGPGESPFPPKLFNCEVVRRRLP